ncbi:hypothetical protein M493_16330 [Geobacillus genomosp. 3]|uniref:Uncharacterized protein n=1 Tax=Geobacillus genomosp. 3 TaxID=1921421 RepID=S5ZGM7_GEOG3|nr:hypothetical protein M493_16330 [Geobacillus genomosp. 3]
MGKGRVGPTLHEIVSSLNPLAKIEKADDVVKKPQKMVSSQIGRRRSFGHRKAGEKSGTRIGNIERGQNSRLDDVSLTRQVRIVRFSLSSPSVQGNEGGDIRHR